MIGSAGQRGDGLMRETSRAAVRGGNCRRQCGKAALFFSQPPDLLRRGRTQQDRSAPAASALGRTRLQARQLSSKNGAADSQASECARYAAEVIVCFGYIQDRRNVYVRAGVAS